MSRRRRHWQKPACAVVVAVPAAFRKYAPVHVFPAHSVEVAHARIWPALHDVAHTEPVFLGP